MSTMKLILSTIFFATLALLSLVSGAPVQLVERDVFVPPVLSPNSSAVWKIGSTQTVTWDVSKPPKQITNTQGKIILVKGGLLDYEHPLAINFNITAGRQKVIVPKVVPGNDYQILVFGDSGNTGELFTISK